MDHPVLVTVYSLTPSLDTTDVLLLSYDSSKHRQFFVIYAFGYDSVTKKKKFFKHALVEREAKN